MKLIKRHERAIRREMKRGAGTDVVLSWVTFDGASTVDPTTGAEIGVATPASETVKGFVHFAENAATGIRMYEEIEAGDAIVDLPSGTVIEGRKQLKVTIDGVVYVQKSVGEKLAKSWDGIVGGVRMGRVLLLRKET